MIRQAIDEAHRHNRHIGICGQAPSDFPEVARELVGMGIDSTGPLDRERVVRDGY